MEFLNNLKQKLKKDIKSERLRPNTYRVMENLQGCFELIDEQELKGSGRALLSFIRERHIRGHARKFRIYLDGVEVQKIRMEEQCDIWCEPGIHRVYIKLDTLTSSVLNVKTEAGKRYYFDIACTMNEGMILRHVEQRERSE